MTKGPPCQETLKYLRFDDFDGTYPNGYNELDVKKKPALKQFYILHCGSIGRKHFESLHFNEEAKEEEDGLEFGEDGDAMQRISKQDRCLLEADSSLPVAMFTQWFKNTRHREPTADELNPDMPFPNQHKKLKRPQKAPLEVTARAAKITVDCLSSLNVFAFGAETTVSKRQRPIRKKLRVL